MSRAAVDQLLYLLDEAFDASGHHHSLLANIRNVRAEDWHWVPPGGSRSIVDIVLHVGECKYVYHNHAFGDGSMNWISEGSVPSVRPDTARDEVIDWLRESQRLLRDSVASLESDDELRRPRKANWGQMYETRWLIAVMIEHDLYHAGEINHIRALKQANDHWAWEAEESPTA